MSAQAHLTNWKTPGCLQILHSKKYSHAIENQSIMSFIFALYHSPKHLYDDSRAPTSGGKKSIAPHF